MRALTPSVLQILFGFFAGIVSGVVLENRLLDRSERNPPRPETTSAIASREVASARPLASKTPAPAQKRSIANKPVVEPTVLDPGARLAVDEAIHQFGERESGEILDHTFKLRNVGTSKLVIAKVVSACGCTVPKLSQTELAPGQETDLLVKLNLSRQKGPQNREIVLQTNDASQPSFKIAMVGKAVPRVKLTPERVQINAGSAPSTGPLTATVNVVAERGLKLNVTGTRTSGDMVAASVKTITPGEVFDVTITLTPPLPPAEFQGWVHLLTDDKGEYRVIGIPVMARPAKDQKGSDEKPATLTAEESGIRAVHVGQEFTFSGPSLDGHQVDQKSLHGKPSFVVFWGSWCEICQKELPKIAAIQQSYRDRLNVVGISLDSKKENAQQYIKVSGITWPTIFFDEDGKRGSNNPIAQQYRVQSLPWVLMLDEKGEVIVDDVRSSDLEGVIAQLAARKNASANTEPLAATATKSPAQVKQPPDSPGRQKVGAPARGKRQ